MKAKPSAPKKLSTFGEKPSPEVLREDRHFMVVIKPSGYLSQADYTGRPDILEWCRAWVAEQRGPGGRPFVGLCHRLDRLVGGLMVVAKTSKAAGRLSAQFRDRTIDKVYSALCLGVLKEPQKRLRQSLVRDGHVTRVAEPGEQSAPCELDYRLLAIGAIGQTKVSYLSIKLITGFKHQIRAQLASLGHPIYGDALYGAPKTAPEIEAIALCSTELSFFHPISRERLMFDCSAQRFWPFMDFRAAQAFDYPGQAPNPDNDLNPGQG
jgi:23S rRNA pseudouridine1911/1915/1917 synthase